MRGRTVVAALALAAAIGVISAPGASGGGKANSKVILDGILYNVPEARTEFNGRISSPKKECANKRKITVYRVVDGADEKIGSKRSEKDGDTYRWFITAGGLVPNDDYYAKAEGGDTCKGDKSEKVLWQVTRAG